MAKMLKDKRTLAAAYLRLSREDGDKVESNSITNQRELINAYFEAQGIEPVDEYVDDGYSGTDFNRPAFQRLMDDCRAKRINCIVVKDLSRLGRNYIETGRYLERIFPVLGVRFIAVTDHYDSFSSEAGNDDIIIPFKNLINDTYCRDISIKIRSQLNVLRNNGAYIGAFAAFGYVKDPEDKHHLIIDEPAANIVRQIFYMKLDGMNHQAIADYLNSIAAETPFERKRNLGYKYNSGFCTTGEPHWDASLVRHILENELYTGTIVQGKCKKVSYKVKECKAVEKDDWIRVEGMHDPIISKEIFDYVQILLSRDTRTAPGRNRLYVLSGFVRCGDCGENMIRRPAKVNGKQYYYYRCSEFVRTHGCSSHNISEEKLCSAVTKAIRTEVESLLLVEDLLKNAAQLPEKRHAVVAVETQIRSLLDETERLQNLKMHLYQDQVEGLIRRNEYEEINERYSSKLKALEDAIEGLQKRRERLMDEKTRLMPWLESIKKYRNIKELNREVLACMVDRIDVFEGHAIEVHFHYEEDIERLLVMEEAEA